MTPSVRLLRGPVAPPSALLPDSAQAAAVAHREGRLLLLGAPGTGRTTTIVEAVSARLAEGADPSSILVLAPDRRSAQALRTSLGRRAGSGSLPTVTTFHSLAFSLVGAGLAADRAAGSDAAEATMPRLLSGAEEDVRIRELLRGAVDDGIIAWPQELEAALPTLGLANEVRALLSRLRDRAADGPRAADAAIDLLLRAAGRTESRVDPGRAAWPAIARLAELDAEIAALENVVDYSGLLLLALERAHELPRPRFLYVDDFHDASRLQARLLDAIAGECLVVAGDPDSSILGFRGSGRRSLLEFAEAHPDARHLVLGTVWRHGARIREAARRVVADTALPPLTAATVADLRGARAAGAEDGRVDVRSYDSWSDLAAHVAQSLRAAYLDGGVPWNRMAVLVRSHALAADLRRALDAADVPVRVGIDDLPLHAEPAVAVLIRALQAAVDESALTDEVALDLLAGPLCRLDPGEVRTLGRALRRAFRERHPGEAVPSSVRLLRAELAAGIAKRGDSADAGELRARLDRLAGVLAQVRAKAEDGAPPAELLWMLWSAPTGAGETATWPERLRAAALAGHRGAAHDLDAVTALFDAAERTSERYGGVVGIPSFIASLSGQRVPAEAVSQRAGTALPAVDLLTVHAARGREWDLVVLCGLQEGAWPTIRHGSSILHVDAVESVLDGAPHATLDPREAAAERIAGERRLLATAITRARRAVHIAVVAGVGDQGEQPSRFVDDLGVPVVRVPGRPLREGTLEGLVAELRTVAEDPASSPALRSAAIAELVLLRDAGTPAADPDSWWGTRDLTPGADPVRPVDRPVALSASALEGLGGCPRKWFLDREAHAQSGRGSALAFGSVLHALADGVARGVLPADPAHLEQVADRVWGELAFDAPWESLAERAALRDALERFCEYHRSVRRGLVATEHSFSVDLAVRSDDGDPDSATLRGVIDRIELTAEGDVVLVDLKTASRALSGPAVRDHVQLSAYQAAVHAGALEEVVGEDVRPVGAALVQLRLDAPDGTGPVVQEQPALPPDDSGFAGLLAQAVRRVRLEDFPAVPVECRNCPYTRSCPAQAGGLEVIP